MPRALLGLSLAAALAVLPGFAVAQQTPSLDPQPQKSNKKQPPQRAQKQQSNKVFLEQREECEQGDIEACEDALTYAKLGSRDRKILEAKRAGLLAQQQIAESERILAQAAEARRIELERLAAAKAAAKPATTPTTNKLVEAPPVPSRAAERWLSGYQAGSLIAGVFVLALAIIGYANGLHIELPSWKGAGLRLRSFASRLRPRRKPRPARPAKQEPVVAAVVAASASPPPAPAMAPPVAAQVAPTAKVPVATNGGTAPHNPRDTVGALRALELAQSYVEEVRNADVPDLEEVTLRKLHLNTLALAFKQLQVAEMFDADAVLELTDAHGMPRRFSIQELKAEAHLLEGLTHQVSDVKRSIAALRAATQEDPNNPSAFFALGLTQAAAKNKKAAIAALRRAVELRPKNLTYRKELGRAENLTSVEVAAYRSTRVGDNIIDASIAAESGFARVRNAAASAFRWLKPTSLH